MCVVVFLKTPSQPYGLKLSHVDIPLVNLKLFGDFFRSSRNVNGTNLWRKEQMT